VLTNAALLGSDILKPDRCEMDGGGKREFDALMMIMMKIGCEIASYSTRRIWTYGCL